MQVKSSQNTSILSNLLEEGITRTWPKREYDPCLEWENADMNDELIRSGVRMTMEHNKDTSTSEVEVSQRGVEDEKKKTMSILARRGSRMRHRASCF